MRSVVLLKRKFKAAAKRFIAVKVFKPRLDEHAMRGKRVFRSANIEQAREMREVISHR